MVIDTSAIVAILTDEPERDALIAKIAADPRRLVSAGTLLEMSLVVEGKLGEVGGRELDLFLHRCKAQVVAVDEVQAETARTAWRRYGKGRHPAGLNYGDLFSYALARTVGEPLLFKGNDFSQTDIAAA